MNCLPSFKRNSGVYMRYIRICLCAQWESDGPERTELYEWTWGWRGGLVVSGPESQTREFPWMCWPTCNSSSQSERWTQGSLTPTGERDLTLAISDLWTWLRWYFMNKVDRDQEDSDINLRPPRACVHTTQSEIWARCGGSRASWLEEGGVGVCGGKWVPRAC